MKKLLVVFVAAAFMLVSATSAMAAIANSKHDLSKANANAYIKEDAASAVNISACAFCHTPHNANTAMTEAPLWNKTTNAGYTTYDKGTGGTLGGTAVGTPGNHSLTCLSCHDGVSSVGVNYATADVTQFTVPNAARSTADGRLIGTLTANLSQNLQDDHPIGFTFTSGSAANVAAGIPGALPATYPLFTDGARTNSFECATCHDPHTANQMFLRTADKSTICVDCHINK